MFFILDLFGTFIFGLSGAFRAVKYELDILGVLVLSIVTGVGGGLMRDALIGATPAASISDERYLIVTIMAGLLVFFNASKLARQWRKIIVSDALGLGVFTAIGVSKGLAFGLGPVGAVIMGVITATGGGVIRDILVKEMPGVLISDFYATASIIGGITFIVVQKCGGNEMMQVWITVLVTTVLRLLAIHFGLSLPKVKKLDRSPSSHVGKKNHTGIHRN